MAENLYRRIPEASSNSLPFRPSELLSIPLMASLRRSIANLAAAVLLATSLHAQDTIKIGEIASLTGKEGAFGRTAHEGALLALKEINAAGGVAGRTFELISEDNQSMPGQAGTVARKLISREKVVAILCNTVSTGALEAASVCQAAHVPMIASTATNPKVTETGSYIFRVCFIDNFQGAVMATFASTTLHVKRAAILSSVSSAYSVGLAKYFRAKFIEAGGEISIERKYSEGEKDFRAQLSAIRASNAEALFVPGYYTEAALICRQARELGLALPVLGGDGWEAPELLEIGGSAMEGTYYSTHYSASNPSPAVTSFVTKFKAMFGGETPPADSAMAYDAMMILKASIAKAESTEGSRIRAALSQTAAYPGVTGSTTINSQRDASKPAVVVEVKDGKFQFLQTITP